MNNKILDSLGDGAEFRSAPQERDAIVSLLRNSDPRDEKETEKETEKSSPKRAGILPAGYEYALPDEYEITENGVVLRSRTTCALPLLWNGAVSSPDGSLRTRLLAYIRGEWREYELPKKAVSRTGELVSAFCEAGLPGASDANARDLMRYLAACEDKNIRAPLLRRVDSGGWFDSGRYYAPFFMPSDCVSSVTWTSSGNWLEAWRKYVRPSTGARCATAAAVGATLLRITGCRSHVVYLYGGSQGGKTAAQTAAAAFFGDPDEVMAAMYGTTVGIELLASKRNDMALILDERQTMNGGNGQETVERIVYMLAGGVGKLRGSKDGELVERSRWRTVALISGEESLSKASSQQGVYSRSLPLYGRPFEDAEAAAACYPVFSSNYGMFEAWIEFVVPRAERIKKSFSEWIQSIERFSAKKGLSPSPSHVRYMANLAVAEQYLSEFAGYDQDQSGRSAGELVLHVMQNFVEETASYSERALSALCQYVFSNMRDFQAGAERRYGDVDLEAGRLYITNERLRTFCDENGFDAERIKQDWKSSGTLFEAKQRRIGAARLRCCEIVLPPEELTGGEDE